MFKRYVKDLVNIALPIIMGNLGFILIGVGDVLIAGRHSTDTLAAISIATAIINCIVTFRYRDFNRNFTYSVKLQGRKSGR